MGRLERREMPAAKGETPNQNFARAVLERRSRRIHQRREIKDISASTKEAQLHKLAEPAANEHTTIRRYLGGVFNRARYGGTELAKWPPVRNSEEQRRTSTEGKKQHRVAPDGETSLCLGRNREPATTGCRLRPLPSLGAELLKGGSQPFAALLFASVPSALLKRSLC